MQTLLWQRLETPCLERFVLEEDDGFTLSGTVVLELDAQPASVTYRITTTPDWRTKQVAVTIERGAKEKKLELRVDEAQRWWQGERELTELRGLYDVDLSITPATNTLPLRRLGPNIGESYKVTAAWVKFPELDLEPLPQRYTRTGEHHYRYESGTAFADFSAELTVDDAALVTEYLSGKRGWTRIVHAQ